MAKPGDKLAAAHALHEKGDLAAAERLYRSLLDSESRNPELLYPLGLLCLSTERVEMAVEYIGAAIDAAIARGQAVNPEWRLALGSARQHVGDHESALSDFDAALADSPGSIDALFCRGTALQALARLDEAADCYNAVLKQQPKHAMAANNLGTVLRDTGRPAAALRAFRRALEADPGYRDAITNVGLALEQGGRFSAAIKVLRRAAALYAEPDEDTEYALSRCLAAEGEVEAAVERLGSLGSKAGRSPRLLAQTAQLMLFLGDAARAVEIARDAVATDPNCGAAHYVLAQSGADRDNKNAVGSIETALENPDVGAFETASLYFAMAKRYSDSKDYEKEFDSFLKGNAVKRDRLREMGYGYDPTRTEGAVEELIAAFEPEIFNDAGGSESETPVFIVGMPRSGTTLIEQILASHRQVAGAGELMFLGEAAGWLRQEAGYPARKPSQRQLSDIAATGLKRLKKSDGEAMRICDKMPSNFMQVGLIALLYPRARIIHCRRDPVDTCLSCYFQNFVGTSQPYSYDLADLGPFYRQYLRIMEHWRQVLPAGARLLEVDYEKLVAGQESESRRMIDFLGLGWDDACLDFHKTARTVTTASHAQVRQPVYSSSVGRWKRYRARLEPLLAALSDCAHPSETS